MPDENLVIDVVAAVISQQNKFLICRRPLHKSHGGLWEFPGGKVDELESISNALARELNEELGLQTISIGNILFSTHEIGSEYKIHFIEAHVCGRLILHEHTEARYCSTNEMKELPLAPTDREFLKFLEHRQ